jgi:hypothetical protein
VPDLLAVVPTRCHNSHMVRSALSDNTWLWDIAGPLTLPLLIQYVQVRELVDVVQVNNDKDLVSWRWSHSGVFSSSSAYVAMFVGQGCRELRSSGKLRRCQSKKNSLVSSPRSVLDE